MAEEPKKAKVDRVFTSVVHIGNLPFRANVTDEMLVALARPYSPVHRIVMLENKGQAFMQLDNADAVRQMVETHEATPFRIENQALFVNPSSRQVLTGGHVPGEAGTEEYNVGTPARIVLVRFQVRRRVAFFCLF